jgi:hypothetical protein
MGKIPRAGADRSMTPQGNLNEFANDRPDVLGISDASRSLKFER